MEFTPMPKTPRLSREIVITEKIDGTNASVYVATNGDPVNLKYAVDSVLVDGVQTWLFAGSRTRWITPSDDNFGFAAWVRENAEDLVRLGPGHHFGEWWGKGIQRGYGLSERRFSLFNVGRWAPSNTCVLDGQERAPECCDVVPVLARVPLFETRLVDMVIEELRRGGSRAAPGFMDPEGVMVYHSAANALFKKTLKGDEEGKHAEAHPKKEPRDPSKGGRRVTSVHIEFQDRRRPK